MKSKDWIIKTEILNLKDNEDQVAVAMRNSGHFDFYWNKKRVFSSEDYTDNDDQKQSDNRIEKIHDISVNFDELLIYAKMTKGTHQCMAFSLNAHHSFNIKSVRLVGGSTSADINESDKFYKWYSKYFLSQKLRDHFKPFSNIL